MRELTHSVSGQREGMDELGRKFQCKEGKRKKREDCRFNHSECSRKRQTLKQVRYGRQRASNVRIIGDLGEVHPINDTEKVFIHTTQKHFPGMKEEVHLQNEKVHQIPAPCHSK